MPKKPVELLDLPNELLEIIVPQVIDFGALASGHSCLARTSALQLRLVHSRIKAAADPCIFRWVVYEYNAWGPPTGFRQLVTSSTYRGCVIKLSIQPDGWEKVPGQGLTQDQSRFLQGVDSVLGTTYPSMRTLCFSEPNNEQPHSLVRPWSGIRMAVMPVLRSLNISDPFFALYLPVIATSSPLLDDVHIEGVSTLAYQDMQIILAGQRTAFESACTAMQAFQSLSIGNFSPWMQSFLAVVKPRAAYVDLSVDLWKWEGPEEQHISAVRHFTEYEGFTAFSIPHSDDSAVITYEETVYLWPTYRQQVAVFEYLRRECAGRGVSFTMRQLVAGWRTDADFEEAGDDGRKLEEVMPLVHFQS